MILPIVAYGDPVLKKMAADISKDYPGLKELISDMYETMYNAKGVGLAAPQVGRSVRLFIVDASAFSEDEEHRNDKELKNFKKVFINARLLNESGEPWSYSEGCLSIPRIREEVKRQPEINIAYLDANFVMHEEKYRGIIARIIQHEYDHVEGKLFVDRINPLRKRLLKGKLMDISRGRVEVGYKMIFPNT
jgi:peptide deformylase